MYHAKQDCVNNLRPNLRQQARGEGDENLTVADVEIEGGGWSMEHYIVLHGRSKGSVWSIYRF